MGKVLERVFGVDFSIYSDIYVSDQFQASVYKSVAYKKSSIHIGVCSAYSGKEVGSVFWKAPEVINPTSCSFYDYYSHRSLFSVQR